MYGAPAWAEEAQRSKRILRILRAILRRIAARVTRGYRTISFAGVTLLAGLPPMELTASMYAETFRRSREERNSPGEGITPWRANAIKAIAKRRLFSRWRDWAQDQAVNGTRVREAVAPKMVEWVSRKWGQPTYRLTQVLSGHGCFGSFLHKIGREVTPGCHHCPAQEDTAQHTLAECPAWELQRDELKRTIGEDLTLPRVVERMLRNRKGWKAVSDFCEAVLLQKEDAERTRRGRGPRGSRRGAARPRRQRGGRGRRGGARSGQA